MNALTPNYRVTINKNMLQYPLFFDFLRNKFRNVLYTWIDAKHLDLMEKYKFTIYTIPVGWGKQVIEKVRAYEMNHDKTDPKLEKIAKVLHDLDPFNPQPVDLEFTLEQICSWVTSSLRHFQETTNGNVYDYFGIAYNCWFDDFPIACGTVVKAVDIGTLDNVPHHLFDNVFADIRFHLMDLFTEYMNGAVEKPLMVKNNADI